MRGSIDRDAAVEDFLGWWTLAGVDSAIQEAPVNWLRPTSYVRPDAAQVAASQTGASVPADTAVMPDTLDAFHIWLAESADVPEAAWPGPRIVPTAGAGARLMVICDMPDPEDGEAGSLLSGDAGRLFDAMMAAIGLSRADIYLAALAIARPAGGLLSPADTNALAVRMRRQIDLARPSQLLLLGDKTSRALLSVNDAATDLRPAKGLRPLNHEGGTMDAVATFHPRLLLRQSAAKAESWRALQHLLEGNQS